MYVCVNLLCFKSSKVVEYSNCRIIIETIRKFYEIFLHNFRPDEECAIILELVLYYLKRSMQKTLIHKTRVM